MLVRSKISKSLGFLFAIMLALPSLQLLPGSSIAKPIKQLCEDIEYKKVSYTVCGVSSRGSDIRLFLNDSKGENWGSFERLSEALAKKGKHLAFAMNAGMYGPDRSPVGLYIENGDKKRKINKRRGPGNFHLLPNGVFFVSKRRAAVLDTRQFLKLRGKILFATQSGPMLVIAGRIHPKFRPDSESFKIRNGVGSCKGRMIYFAISNKPVTFHAFASLFKDRLKCRYALFLDGSISTLYAPSIKRDDGWRPLGPIVGVVQNKNTAK